MSVIFFVFFFFSSRRRHTRFDCDWSSDVCSSDLIQIARSHGVPVVCIWLKADLQTALRRNTQRRADHQVPEQAIRSVFAMFEPPSEQEGFAVIHIDDTEPAPGSSIQQIGRAHV